MIHATRELEALECAGRTARGNAEGANQDRFLIGHLNRTLLVSDSNTLLGSRARLSGGSIAHVLLVADGLGDSVAGEAAAEAVADVLARQFVEQIPSFYGVDQDAVDRLRDELDRAVARCHHSVVRVEQRAAARDVGSTLTAAYVLWPRMYLVHLGDSRCYLVRDGALRRLTSDHVRAVGADDPAGAAARRGVLTNALGAGIRRPAPDFQLVELQAGDDVVLCTGGLARRLDEDALLATVLDAETAQDACAALVERGAGRGDADDATAVVARFRSCGPTGPTDAARAAADDARA